MCAFHRLDDAAVLRRVLDQADRAITQGVAAEAFTASLRGIDAEQHLVRLTGLSGRGGAAGEQVLQGGAQRG